MEKQGRLKFVECPRDAMQGMSAFVPTELKIEYLNQLLRVGFDTLDFGSFVSPQAIPQMRDTKEVVQHLQLQEGTDLLAIVANLKGAQDACSFEQIRFMGYPFSISETFQLRNTNSTIEKSFELVKRMQNMAIDSEKEIVIYLSMAFGNPYGDEWNADKIALWMDRLASLGIHKFALSDTIGVSTPESIRYLFGFVLPRFPVLEIGAHFHSLPDKWEEKLEAAYHAGCRRFDGALKAYGGCPMAKDELVGNMPMEKMLVHFKNKALMPDIHWEELQKALLICERVFSQAKLKH